MYCSKLGREFCKPSEKAPSQTATNLSRLTMCKWKMKQGGSEGKWKQHFTCFSLKCPMHFLSLSLFLVFLDLSAFLPHSSFCFSICLFNLTCFPREKQTSSGTTWPPSIKAKTWRWVINSLLYLLHIAGGPSSCLVQSSTLLLWLEEQKLTTHSLI